MAEDRATHRIVVAPDKFKGSLDARQAADAIVCGLREVWPDAACTTLPMADGGEGTVDAFLTLPAWHAEEAVVFGPLGRETPARFAMSGTTAVLEMAAASGLALLDRTDTRGAREGSSFGTGQLVRAALDRGATRIVVGVGGTATNDGGAGALAALGARLYDANGRELAPGGAALATLARIDLCDLDPRLRSCELDVATDVDNPLTGPRGASAVFGPQKGANQRDVAELDAALVRFADVLWSVTQRDTRAHAGSGAGGGIAFGLAAIACTTIASGFALVADVMGLDAALDRATLCCTGEGSIDEQTSGGKVVFRVAERAHARGLRTYAFGGRVDPQTALALARLECEAIAIADAGVPLASAMRDARANLALAARTLATRVAR